MTAYLRVALAAVVLAAVIGGGVYVVSLRDSVDQLRERVAQVTTEREEARRVAQANADAAEQISTDAERRFAIINDTLTTERRLRAQFVDIRQEIRHVPTLEHACAVDPAVLRAVERLRR